MKTFYQAFSLKDFVEEAGFASATITNVGDETVVVVLQGDDNVEMKIINGVVFVPVKETNGVHSFQQAIAMLKEGKRVGRVAWVNEWVCLAEGFDGLPADKFWNKHTSKMARLNGGAADVRKYFLYVTRSNKVQMGWTPTQADMLADDWWILED